MSAVPGQRAKALELAVQICCVGSYENIERRSDVALIIADKFLAHLAEDDATKAPPEAPAARMAA